MSRNSAMPAGQRLAEAKWEERRSGLITPVLPADPAVLAKFEIIQVLDPTQLDISSRLSGPPNDTEMWSYQLQDRGLIRARFDSPITNIIEGHLGSMTISHGSDRFATQIDIVGGGVDAYCFSAMSHGQVGLLQHGDEFLSVGHSGLAFRGTPGTRILASDVNARENLWIDAAALEHALEALLGERLRERLAFKPAIDWACGLAASLRGQIDFLAREMARQGGVTDNPVAMASVTDLMVSLVLRGIPNNYLERLGKGRFGAVPAYVRRAEDFMHANAAVAITMENVAAAAGCSVRTLGSVFRQFRDTTPLAALHRIRLEHAHAELGHRASGTSIAEVARRYGFTNAGRFAAAYRRRFGASPVETARRGSR